MRLARGGTRGAARRPAGDEGISLVEVVVALMIIAVVMASAAGFFLKSLKTTGGAASRQASVNVVNQELEAIRAVPSDKLLYGRTSAAVQAILAWPGAAALTVNDDTSNTQSGAANYDTSGGAALAVMPLQTQTVNNVTYTLRNYIDPCWLIVAKAQASPVNNLSCGATYSAPTSSTTTTMLYRVTVAATWTGGPSTNCTKGCTYSASTLVDPGKDALFQSNISQPTITGISPSTIGAGASAVITVSGAGFVSGAVATTCPNATVGTVDQSTNTGVSIKIPITASATVGSCTLTLTNPDGGNASTTFQISQPPTVTSVSPSVQNYTTKTVTITGASFGNPTVVPATGTWSTSGTPTATSVAGSFTANAPAAGAVGFTLTNADGGQGTGSITVTQSTPVVTSAGVTLVTDQSISGSLAVTDLAPAGATLSTSGGSVALTGQSGGTLNATYVAPSTPGSYVITVTNPDGGTATYPIKVNQGAPVLNTVADSTVSCGKNCYTVTYTATGTSFGPSPTATLSFKGGTATAVTLTSSSDTQVVFKMTYTTNPVNATYAIVVSNSAGSSASKSGVV